MHLRRSQPRFGETTKEKGMSNKLIRPEHTGRPKTLNAAHTHLNRIVRVLGTPYSLDAETCVRHAATTPDSLSHAGTQKFGLTQTFPVFPGVLFCSSAEPEILVSEVSSRELESRLRTSKQRELPEELETLVGKSSRTSRRANGPRHSSHSCETGAVEDAPAIFHWQTGAVEDAPAIFHWQTGAVEDAPPIFHWQTGAVEDAPPIFHWQTGAVEDAPPIFHWCRR